MDPQRELLIRRILLLLIATVSAVIVVILSLAAVPSWRQRLTDQFYGPKYYSVGQSFDLDIPVTERPTVILFATVTCPTCVELVPFFDDLRSELSKLDFDLLLIRPPRGGEASAAETKFAESFRVMPESVFGSSVPRLRVAPTIIALRSGRVMFVHEGPPSQGEEQKLIDAITSALK